MEDIINLITTIGFPAACFIMAGLYVKYREDKNDEKIEKIVNQHHDEIGQMTEALNNNTLAIQKLTNKLERNS